MNDDIPIVYRNTEDLEAFGLSPYMADLPIWDV